MARQKGFKNPNAGRRKVPLIIEVPPREIILDQVFYWIDLQATQQEIAGSFRVSVETLNARILDHFGMNFAELRKRCDGGGKLSLRRYQFDQAKKNTSMAIWLGKQWLGQKDDPSEEFEKTNKLVQVLLDEIMQMKQQRNDDMKKVVQPVYDGHPDSQKS